ncbi:TetR/AcrR family transcriptional regulator [Saccharothrix algeriensis]|uniref:TetR/AcrR family transcriptional regulator n=1 Tax=Saccharothrix algeriensis TaxID=173560 RepID=A0A8T8I6N4_9PSEU|nr:TetR/AcrR family transcriptional regulator [Saccharothrix algeriensis]
MSEWPLPRRRARSASQAKPARTAKNTRAGKDDTRTVTDPRYGNTVYPETDRHRTGRPARPTRAQSQQLTRERLVAAGRVVFLRRGYLAATVEEVAAEAGYTRGALYKHFGGKEGLWQAVLDARAQAHLSALRAAFDGASSRAELLAALAPPGPPDEEAARWSAAAAEVLAATARQPATAAAVVAAQRRHDEELAALLTRHCDRLGVGAALPPDRTVVVLGALGAGLALRRCVDREVDAAAVTADVLETLFPAGPPG